MTGSYNILVRYPWSSVLSRWKHESPQPVLLCFSSWRSPTSWAFSLCYFSAGFSIISCLTLLKMWRNMWKEAPCPLPHRTSTQPQTSYRKNKNTAWNKESAPKSPSLWKTSLFPWCLALIRHNTLKITSSPTVF